ncbi:hypothetical protein B296_00058677, partial [Ensete ventricosum]
MYRSIRLPVCGPTAAQRYHQNRSSTVDFGRWLSIEEKSTVGDRLREKKGRRRRRGKEERRDLSLRHPCLCVVVANAPSSLAGCPCAILTRGRFSSRARRRNVSPFVSSRGEKDR